MALIGFILLQFDIVLSLLFFFNADGRIADCYLRSLGKTRQQFFFRIIEFVAKTFGVIVGSKWELMGVTIGIVLMECLVKLVKVIYAGHLISMTFGNIMKILLQSCRYSIIILPFLIVLHLILPQTIQSEVIILFSFNLLYLKH